MSEETQPKPNCYDCRYRGGLVGTRHSCCRHPDALGPNEDAFDAFMRTAGGMMGTVGDSEKLGVTGSAHGIRCGWFFWPTDFDPTWLLSCTGFEPKAPS